MVTLKEMYWEIERAFKKIQLLEIEEAILSSIDKTFYEEILIMTMTAETVYGLNIVAQSTEDFVINKMEVEEETMKKIDELKKDLGRMFDCMDRLDPEEREILQSVYLGQTTNLSITKEQLNEIIKKLYGHLKGEKNNELTECCDY